MPYYYISYNFKHHFTHVMERQHYHLLFDSTFADILCYLQDSVRDWSLDTWKEVTKEEFEVLLNYVPTRRIVDGKLSGLQG